MMLMSGVTLIAKKKLRKDAKFMPLDAKSLANLATCHDHLQQIVNRVAASWNLIVLEGYRDKEKQEADFAAGKTKLHFPNGRHNQMPSLAVDMIPSPIDWNDTKRLTMFAGYVLGVADMLYIPLRWGGDWKNLHDPSHNTFNDLVHFELLPTHS
jgi:peptidoglycan LD-endopeptidase CwlK